MSILVVAEHDNRPQPGHAHRAGRRRCNRWRGPLWRGQGLRRRRGRRRGCRGVGKVLCADNDAYAHQLAENVAPLIAGLGKDYGHVVGAHSTGGKNAMPRVAAQLDVAMISDVIGVDSRTPSSVRSTPATRSRRCSPRTP